MTPRQIVLAQVDAQSSQFEASGELRSVRLAHVKAIRADDLEQAYIARLAALLPTCTCGTAHVAMPLFLAREELDRQQRQATEQAVRHTDLATGFQRTSNALLDRAMAGLRLFLNLGKWKQVS